MHELHTVAMDDPVVWASVSVCVRHAGDCSQFLFSRWRHFDAAITTFL